MTMITRCSVVMGWVIAAILAYVLILLSSLGVAHASEGKMSADARCVVIGLHMVEMAAPQKRAAGMMVAVYYLGRLDGRATDAEIERLIEKEAEESMTAAEFHANATRCGKALEAKGQEIRKIAAELSRREQKKSRIGVGR